MFADEMRPVVFRYLGITPESYVLDGGWGTGVFTRYIARGLKGGKIVGFDISKTLVAYGRSKIEEENLSDTCELNPYTLVVDAGDTFHGQTIATLNKGESVARLMNEMGFNAMAPGNHDFNYGCEWLVELEALTDFPILAANVKKDDGSGLLDAYVILEVGGLSIGVFGLATPETTSKTNPNNIKGLIFTDPTEAARQVVEALQDETDIIIALTHLGMDGSSIDTSIKLAETVEGIDLIVDGHSHTVLEQGNRVRSTLIVSTGEYGQSLGIVDLYYKDGQIVSIEARLLGMDSAAAIAPDEAIVSMIEMIEADQVEELMRVVGSTAVALEGAREKVRTGETNLGNLITDAMVSATGADCALLNGGGIRASIDAGEITVGEIINVLPFGNYVITKRVTGADIKAALEHGTSAYPELAGGFPHVSGMRFVMDLTREPGSRVVDIFINGQPLDLDKQYILATVDFLAAGGDPCTMLKDAPVVGEYGTLDEIVRGYIQAAGTVNPAVEGRITVRGAAGEVSHLESN